LELLVNNEVFIENILNKISPNWKNEPLKDVLLKLSKK
jgi:hypothetical protein